MTCPYGKCGLEPGGVGVCLCKFDVLRPHRQDCDGTGECECDLRSTNQWFADNPPVTYDPHRLACDSCGTDADDECPKSHYGCGHHCNHSWSHDQCCWCGEEF